MRYPKPQRRILDLAMYTGSAAVRFFPFGEKVAITTIASWTANSIIQGYQVPYDCHVVEVRVRQDTDPGSTTIGLHKDLNDTPTYSTTDSPSGADVSHRYAFGGAARYSAGEILSLSQDPTNAPTERVTASIVIEEMVD